MSVAAQNGHTEVVKKLIEAKANINQQTKVIILQYMLNVAQSIPTLIMIFTSVIDWFVSS